MKKLSEIKYSLSALYLQIRKGGEEEAGGLRSHSDL